MRFTAIQRRRRIICLALALNGVLNHPVRSMWVHPIYQNREQHGEYFTLYKEYRQYDDKFFNWYRMSVEKCDELFNLLEPSLMRQPTNFRERICAEDQLVVTITSVFLV